MEIKEGWIVVIALGCLALGFTFGAMATDIGFYHDCRDMERSSVNGGVIECKIVKPRRIER